MTDVDPYEAIRLEMASRHVYDPCGALSPRTACERHFHPGDPVHYPADRSLWWRDGDTDVTFTDPSAAPSTANAQDRANRRASPEGGDRALTVLSARSAIADESTARTLDLEHIRQQVPIVYAGGYGNSPGHSVREHHLAGLDAIAEWVATLTRARRG